MIKTDAQTTRQREAGNEHLDDEQYREYQRMPSKYRPMYLKAMSGRLGFSIQAKCRQCNAYEDATKRTRECHISACPLWAVRR